MGQRHQLIVVYPKMDLGAGNCNNKPQRAEVIHHQWLYGRSAILALDRILKLVKNSYDGKGTDYLFGRDDRGYTGGDGTNAIAAAVSVDPEEGYYHNVHVWEPADWNGMTGGRGSTGYVEPKKLEPDMFDNNDGITLIEFRVGEMLPRVAFITPSHLEGQHYEYKKTKPDIGPWSAREYLEFYYSTEQQNAWPDDLKAAMGAVLKRIEENCKYLTAAEVKKLLPKFKTKEK